MTARGLTRRLPIASARPVALVWAALPLALILFGDIVRQARPTVLVALVAGFAVSALARSWTRWMWAAPIPIAVWLTWRIITAPLAHPGGLDCADAASPPAVWRLAQALLALGATAILLGVLAVRPGGLWLRRPSPRVTRLSLLGFGVAAPLGLVLGALIARPYFGTFELNLDDPGALVPGMAFSVSNGVAEEVIYRGAFMAFAGRVLGLRWALLLQAIVFGVAHAGAHFLGSPVPVILATGIGGVVAGVLVLRTGSLLLPIAVHVAVDLPIYAYFACRNPLPV